MLLADIRDAFNDRHTNRLTSTQLLDDLLGLEDRPWAEWRRGKPMTTNNLARQLKPHNIGPTTIRINGKPDKGYERCDFQESWERYCSPLQTVTRLQPASLFEKPHITAVTSAVSSSHEQPSVTALPLVTANSGTERDSGSGGADMTAAVELIRKVEEAGGSLRVDDGFLVIAPKDAIAHLVDDLRQYKAEVINLLRSSASRPIPPADIEA